jgi:hypothetical protein
MPDLEEKIAGWRKRMAAGGINTPAVLDELEGHLREEIRGRLSAGDSENQACERAVARIGSAKAMRAEFNKIKGATGLPVMIGVSIWSLLVVVVVVFVLRRMAVGKMYPLLFTHIIILTSGYLAAFLAGGFGILYVGWRWSGRLSPAREQSLGKAVLRFIYISGGLITGGFLLGALWSRQHLGFYLEGSPRGIGCLCACAWSVALCLGQGFGKMTDPVRMLLSIAGNVVVGLAWFYAVVPGMGLNAIAAYWPMEVFLGMHFIFFLMGLRRRFETVQL